MAFRSGFVTIIGRPNVGKSTLLNLLTGEKIAIMSDKPQTTRNTIKTIVTTNDYQIVFMDTPGMHRPKNKLGDYMQKSAITTLDDVDVILYIVEATDKTIGPGDLKIIELLKDSKTPIILLINKVDLVEKQNILPLIDQYSKVMNFDKYAISALNSETKDLILKETAKCFEVNHIIEDMLTDQPKVLVQRDNWRKKYFISSARKFLMNIGVEVILFKEKQDSDLIEIHANIIVKREP